jgi:multiple sugar transport system ATP-binding protein
VAKFGSVAQHGTPFELYHRPRNKFVAGFIGSPKMNFAAAKVVAVQDDAIKVQLTTGETIEARVKPAHVAVGASVVMGVRPEHALLGGQLQNITRSVLWQEHLGELTHVYLESTSGNTDIAADDAWMIKVSGHASNTTGDRIQISLSPASIHVFDDRGLALERSVSDEELKASHHT